MNCYICFTNDPILFSCIDQKCNTPICPDCLKQYFNFCLNDTLLPKCPNELCFCYIIKKTINNPIFQKTENEENENENEEIEIENENKNENKNEIDSFEEIKNELLNIHKKVIMNFFNSEIKKKNEQKNLINAYIQTKRQEKIDFIEKEFPKAITTLLKISLKKKLDKINANKWKLKQNINTTTNKIKKCMAYTCDGYLVNFRCNKCELLFCSSCELVLDKNHKCKDEDIDSLLKINSMIHCPGCGITIEKESGCDKMKCNNCKVFFDYSTGEKNNDTHGGDNQEIQIKEKKKLSEIYNNLPENILQKIIIYENFEPIEQTKLLNIKKSYKSFEDYVINNLENKKYFIYLSQIEQKCISNTINEKFLDDIINLIQPTN